MRKDHRLALAKRLDYPKRLIFLDTETTTIKDADEIHRPTLILGIAEYLELDNDLNASNQHRFIFTNVDDFWVWLYDKITQKDTLYMFAHNWGFDFPVIDGFTYFDRLGFTLTSIVDACPPVILRFQSEKFEIQVIDSLNYFKSSLKQMGDALGLNKYDIEFNGLVDAKLIEYCKRDVEILRKSVLSLITYLKENDLCRLSQTISSLALNAFNRKFQPRPIFIDGKEKRSTYARNSYFGGRTECFRIGKYKGPFYLIDINSQYPFVMKHNPFPVSTVGHYKDVNIWELEQLLTDHCLIAKVDVKTRIPALPRKINSRTCFPTGSFTTYLTTPEIRYCLEYDLITKLHSYVIYEQDYIFKDYVDFFYQQKADYKRQGNQMWSSLAKYFLNTLYGKFGQVAKKWEKTEYTPKGFPRTFFEYDAVTEERIYMMELNGVVYEATREGESRDSFPAIAAHVTAGGRLLIQKMIDYIGLKNVWYCDTDSLLINQEGYEKVKGNLHDYNLGQWSLDGTFEDIEIRGCKDYIMGDKERIKGIRPDAERLEKGLYRQIHFSSLRGVIRSNQIDSPIIKHIHKQLKRVYMKGHVDSSGGVKPFNLVDGELSPTPN